mgnify:CR=1 FL=1
MADAEPVPDPYLGRKLADSVGGDEGIADQRACLHEFRCCRRICRRILTDISLLVIVVYAFAVIHIEITGKQILHLQFLVQVS